MELRLEAVEGSVLPQGCYIGVRVGDVLKQGRYEPNRCYNFPQAADRRRTAKIDLYQHIGSCAVVCDPDAKSTHEVTVAATDPTAPPMKLSVSVQSKVPEDKKLSIAQRSQALRVKAKEYLQKHGIEERLSEAVKALLQAQPEDPVGFICDLLMPEKASSNKAPAFGKSDQKAPEILDVPAQARNDVGRIRDDARDALLQACDTGVLHAALADLRDQKEVNQAPSQQAEAVSPGKQRNLEALRDDCRGMLLQACTDGSLDNVLSDVTGIKPASEAFAQKAKKRSSVALPGQRVALSLQAKQDSMDNVSLEVLLSRKQAGANQDSPWYTVVTAKMRREDADKDSDLVDDFEVPIGTAVKALQKSVLTSGVERVQFAYDSKNGWLSVKESDGTVVLVATQDLPCYTVAAPKLRRAAADKNSDVVDDDEVPIGTAVQSLQKTSLAGGIERVQFAYDGKIGWLSVKEADGTVVLKEAQAKDEKRSAVEASSSQSTYEQDFAIGKTVWYQGDKVRVDGKDLDKGAEGIVVVFEPSRLRVRFYGIGPVWCVRQQLRLTKNAQDGLSVGTTVHAMLESSPFYSMAGRITRSVNNSGCDAWLVDIDRVGERFFYGKDLKQTQDAVTGNGRTDVLLAAKCSLTEAAQNGTLAANFIKRQQASDKLAIVEGLAESAQHLASTNAVAAAGIASSAVTVATSMPQAANGPKHGVAVGLAKVTSAVGSRAAAVGLIRTTVATALLVART